MGYFTASAKSRASTHSSTATGGRPASARCPGVHRRSLQRDLRDLIEKHLVVAEGATNRLVYRAAGKR